MKRPLKTVFLMEDLCWGGTQKQNLELARRLDRARFTPAILTLTGPTDMDADAAGLELRHLGTRRQVPPFFFASLGGVLASLKPDILIPCTALPNIWGRIWGKILGIRLVIGTCRGGGAPKRQHEKFLWQLADHIVCNSLASVEAMRAAGAPASRLTFIANGLDASHFCPPPQRPENSLIVCVARLAEDKNHRLLLRAFALLKEKVPAARLRLVGEGPEEKALAEFVARELPAAVAENVEFAGASGDPLPHYQEAAVFALASQREGLPNVLLEAMACGLPVCATNVGGIPQAVRDGETGLLSESGDAAALAENLARLLLDRPLAAKMGAAARKAALAGYSYEKMVESHEKLFEEQFERQAGKAGR